MSAETDFLRVALALQNGIHIYDHILPGNQATAQVKATRIDKGDAIFHTGHGLAQLVAALQCGQLGAGIHAEHFIAVRGGDAVYHGAVRDRPGDNVREVILALGIIVIKRIHPLAQSARWSCTICSTTTWRGGRL